MNKYDEIAQRYADGGIRDDQLDGTGAPEGSVYLARNYVALGAITQAQADAIRAGAADPAVAELQARLNIITEGSETA
ncbi:hypothetical protein [uncultured Anaerotruncus sp.]|uniref:hypothetical protein n=1 Tax=uncultured Anaerotruncus sp. TaxID=905011 RepID=UPI0032202735